MVYEWDPVRARRVRLMRRSVSCLVALGVLALPFWYALNSAMPG
jgi:hypothetical protein